MKTAIYFYLFILVSICQCQHETTTTTKPTTTTQTSTTIKPKPTPTPPPKPSIPVVQGKITTKNGNETCLRYHFSLFMKLAYTQNENKTIYHSQYLPENAIVVSDNCSNKTFETLSFKFGKQFCINMTFEQKDVSIFLSSILVTYPDNESNITRSINITNPNPNFSVDKSHSYACAHNISIKNNGNDQSELIFSNLTIQAFMQPSQNGTFSEEYNCQNEINDVVPIVVGAALTSLVIIVMIAYFIGRRRSRRLAYQSV